MNVSQTHQNNAAKTHQPKVRLQVAKSDERKGTVAQPEYLGLCSTCRHSKTCTYLCRQERPVLFCEEFEVEEVESKRTHSHDEQAADQATIPDMEKYPGLCSTCEHRETCTLPKPEGGVWQCEEFE